MGTLDVEHRRAGREKVVVVEGEDRTRRDTGKRSECAVVSLEGLLGDFWTAVLNQVSFPWRVSGTSNPFSLPLPPSLTLPPLSLFLSHVQPACDILNKAYERLATNTSFFLCLTIFFYVPSSIKRGKRRIARAEENAQTSRWDRFGDQSSIISVQFFEMDWEKRSFSRTNFGGGIISRVNV